MHHEHGQDRQRLQREHYPVVAEATHHNLAHEYFIVVEERYEAEAEKCYGDHG